ncbi:serine protease [Aureococcus anophagefferens]|nr:serine protease [Aureococcus anophagefferens]
MSCGPMLVCLPARVDDGDDIGKSINPRPQWAWPARHGPVTEVAAVLGVKYSTSCFLTSTWTGCAGSATRAGGQAGWLELRRCDVHADVSRIHGRRRPSSSSATAARAQAPVREPRRHERLVERPERDAGAARAPRRGGGRAPVDDDDRDDLEPTGARRRRTRAARNEFHVDLARGAFEPQLFLSIRRAYEQVLGMIIRPRAKYDVRQLGPSFAYGAARGARAPYVRDDFFVANARGLRACTTLSLCCGLGLSVCAIDCSGSGASDGEYISLGLEAEDVVAVVDHLKRDYGLNRYGLWGGPWAP